MKAAHSLLILGAIISYSSLAMAADDVAPEQVEGSTDATNPTDSAQASPSADGDVDSVFLPVESPEDELPPEAPMSEESVREKNQARLDEAQEICEATCLNTTDEPQCLSSCADQTYYCFDRCDQLSGNSADCFISCTQIAVDYGVDWEETHGDGGVAAEEAIPPGRKFAFGMNLVGGLHFVPKFALNALLDMSVPHWRDGAKFFYGGEFVFRFDDRNDFLVGIDYADFRTQDGWWLEKNDPTTSVDWVENDLRALTITLAWNGIANLDKKKRAQIYGGVGLGAAIRMGEFKKAELTVGCVTPDQDLSIFSGLTPESLCPASGGRMLQNRNASGEITQWEVEKIPAVLPSLVVTAGFRYLIADTISIGVEGGFKTAAFYGGLKVGFIVGRTHRQAARQAAPVLVTSEDN